MICDRMSIGSPVVITKFASLPGSTVPMSFSAPNISAGQMVSALSAASFGNPYATASAALWTLEGTDARIARDQALPLGPQVLLWGSLSLFLGIFLGLVLQGRSTFQDG